jgi:predicted  nucleic acid-binding Zn-ribbon protein
VKISEKEKGRLLELAKLEMDLRVLSQALKKAVEADLSDEANREFFEVSEKLSATRSELEDSELEHKRTAQDLELVEARIVRDERLLQNSSNSNEINSLQHELETLKNRKSALETELLERMDQQESVGSIIQSLTEQKQKLREHVEKVEREQQAQLLELEGKKRDLEAKREEYLGGLPPEIADEYSRKATRGVPVGVLESGACSACHLNLTATDLASIRATSPDELVNCPECQAILLR